LDAATVNAAPRIAVLIPCYRDGHVIEQAIASIRERERVEIAVVDDRSDDPGTAEVLERLASDGVTVVRHEHNQGPAAARNTGLSATTADYVFPLDADDLAVPGVLAVMADRLDEEPDAAVCYGDYLEFGEAEIVRAVPGEIDPYRVAFTNEYPVSALYRRTVLDSIGGWPKLRAYEDWHVWMTLAELGYRGIHLGPAAITYRRRLHGHRLLQAAKAHHPRLYRELRREHPGLFAKLPEHRRRSSMSARRRFLYPYVYGGRRRFRWERRVKALLDRVGVWTLRR
jgi:glycosyltransferase involved in cell wall biosynthesis